MDSPNYVATKSAWAGVTFLRVLFFWLIIPLLIMIFDIMRKKSETIEFYDGYIIHKKGLLNKKEDRFKMTGIVGVRVNQTLWQRICNYGDIVIDVQGKWDIDTTDIANPNELKNFLSKYIGETKNFTNVINN